MMDDPTLLFSLGGGVLAGIAVGLALKSALRIVLIITGVVLIGLALLMQAGFITIHWEALTTGLEDGATFIGGWVKIALADLSAQLVGFTGGLLMGFKWRS